MNKNKYNLDHKPNVCPPLTEHYWCHKVWVNKIKAERVSGTVFFKHKYITQPTLTPYDAIIKALQDLNHAIKGTTSYKEM